MKTITIELSKESCKAALKELKEAGLWVYGTAADGACGLWSTDLKGPIALVIGSEGDGMGRLVRESCDFVLSLPMKGRLNSLNASAAAAVTIECEETISPALCAEAVLARAE